MIPRLRLVPSAAPVPVRVLPVVPPPVAEMDLAIVRRFLRRHFIGALVEFTISGCRHHRTEAGKAIMRLIALEGAVRGMEIDRLLARCRDALDLGAA